MSMRKKVFFAIMLLGVAVMTVHVVHALTFDRAIRIREVAFHSPRLPPEMSGYRIAFIADTHATSEDAQLLDIVALINDLDVDMLLLGGDYVSLRGEVWARDRFRGLMFETMGVLGQIHTADGIFGVQGNHDTTYYYAAMVAAGIRPLSNSGFRIREGFFVAGVQDYWRGRPDTHLATAGADPDDFVILVTHNPDLTMTHDTAHVDLILAGHTHGGQITLLGLWAPALTLTNYITAHGQRFMSGWAYSRDGTPVFVTTGAGGYLPRIFARPEVVVISLFSY